MTHGHEHRSADEPTAIARDARNPSATRQPLRRSPEPQPGPGHAQPQPQQDDDVGPGAHAAAVDPRIRDAALNRLKRIEGQVRGLHRMVEEGRYCADILMQIASAHEALRGVGKLLMRNHLEHCVTDALRSGDGLAAERAYAEVLDLMYKHAR